MKKKVIASLFAMFIGGIAVFAQDPMVDKKNTDSKPPYIYPEESIVREKYRKVAGYEIRYVYPLGNIQPMGYSRVLVHLSGSI